MFKKTVVCLAVLMIFASAACAAEPSPWTKESTPKDQRWKKLEFGLTNALFGWTELFSEPYEAYQQKADGKAFGMSILEGVKNALGDTVGGVLHVATAPLVNVDVPLPEGGVDLINKMK